MQLNSIEDVVVAAVNWALDMKARGHSDQPIQLCARTTWASIATAAYNDRPTAHPLASVHSARAEEGTRVPTYCESQSEGGS